MSVLDYVGRTIDILAFQGGVANKNVLLAPQMAGGGNSGEICTGIQKLAQRWLMEFLTEAGSITYLPTRGCEFITLVRQGTLRTNIDAQQAFCLSALQVQLNLVGDQPATAPTDEQLASATLVTLNVAGDTLSLTVNIVSMAGDAVQFIVPIATTVTG